jgi:hypothetical protein
VGNTFPIADGDVDEAYPSLAYNTHRRHYLAVWHNDRPGNDDIQARKISEDGNPIGGPFYVAAGPGAERRFPDVAYNPAADQYLVVWEDYNHTSGETTIRGQRLTGTGALLGGGFEIFSGSPSGTPAVAYAGASDKYLVVWWWFDLVGHSIMGRTITAEGVRGTTEYIHEDTGSDAAFQPDVAYCQTRNEHLVVWQAEKSPTDHDIHARRVTGGGMPLNPPAIHVSTLGHDESEPVVAALPVRANRGDYLVAWELDFGPDRGVRTRTVHVAADGSASFGLYQLVGDRPGDERAPAVAGHAGTRRYLVAWQQHVEIDLGLIFLVHDPMSARAVALDGSPLGAGARIVGGWETPHGAIAAGPHGEFLVAFEDVGPAANSGVYGRLWGVRLYLPMVLRRR